MPLGSTTANMRAGSISGGGGGSHAHLDTVEVIRAPSQHQPHLVGSSNSSLHNPQLSEPGSPASLSASMAAQSPRRLTKRLSTLFDASMASMASTPPPPPPASASASASASMAATPPTAPSSLRPSSSAAAAAAASPTTVSAVQGPSRSSSLADTIPTLSAAAAASQQYTTLHLVENSGQYHTPLSPARATHTPASASISGPAVPRPSLPPPTTSAFTTTAPQQAPLSSSTVPNGTAASAHTAATATSTAPAAETASASAAPAAAAGGSAPAAAPRPARIRAPAPSRYVAPTLPSAPNMEHASPPAMYWSRAPVHGNIPRRSFKAHTACLADEILWIFGGCDASACFKDLFCFDTETMCWSRPRVEGELVPPSRRAHSATMVDRRLFVFAGGDGPAYYNDVWIFDTVSLRWSKPEVYGTPPSPRRAHTSSYWDQQLIIFGGGNGIGALNDVYSLDLRDLDRLEWKKWECFGKVPIGRGYHTSNLVDGKLIVIGGSDGHTSFGDIHILKLDTKYWYHVTTEEQHLRMGHTATQVGSYLFVVGGHDGASYTSDILTLNLVNLQWEPRRVYGRKPPGRGYHEAWLRDSRLFMHGGYDGRQIYDDCHYVDLAACAYLPQITSFGIELEEEEEEEDEEGEGEGEDDGVEREGAEDHGGREKGSKGANGILGNGEIG